MVNLPIGNAIQSAIATCPSGRTLPTLRAPLIFYHVESSGCTQTKVSEPHSGRICRTDWPGQDKTTGGHGENDQQRRKSLQLSLLSSRPKMRGSLSSLPTLPWLNHWCLSMFAPMALVARGRVECRVLLIAGGDRCGALGAARPLPRSPLAPGRAPRSPSAPQSCRA
jgi:hypothetical protein